MLKKRYPIVLLTVCLTLVAHASAIAGTARLVALGGDSSYFTDSANVLQWYSSLVNYPDQVEFELGDVMHDSAEPLNAEGMIAHGGGVHAQLGWGTTAFYFQDQLDNGPIDGAFSALWSKNIGPLQWGLGGRFTTFGQSRVGTEIGDRVKSQYYHQYGMGVAGEIRPGFRIEAAGEIVNTMISSSGALENLTPTDDWSTYGLRLRGFIAANSNVTLVPLVDYSCQEHGDYDTLMGGPVDRDANTLRLGLGANIIKNQNQLLVTSCEYRTGSENLQVRTADTGGFTWGSSDREFYQIRCRAGMESTITQWLTVRASVSYIRIHDDQYRLNENDPLREEHYVLEGVTTPVALGIGLHYGSLSANFTYNDTAPLADPLIAEEMLRDTGDGYSALTLEWKF